MKPKSKKALGTLTLLTAGLSLTQPLGVANAAPFNHSNSAFGMVQPTSNFPSSDFPGGGFPDFPGGGLGPGGGSPFGDSNDSFGTINDEKYTGENYKLGRVANYRNTTSSGFTYFNGGDTVPTAKSWMFYSSEDADPGYSWEQDPSGASLRKLAIVLPADTTKYTLIHYDSLHGNVDGTTYENNVPTDNDAHSLVMTHHYSFLPYTPGMSGGEMSLEVRKLANGNYKITSDDLKPGNPGFTNLSNPYAYRVIFSTSAGKTYKMDLSPSGVPVEPFPMTEEELKAPETGHLTLSNAPVWGEQSNPGDTWPDKVKFLRSNKIYLVNGKTLVGTLQLDNTHQGKVYINGEMQPLTTENLWKALQSKYPGISNLTLTDYKDDNPGVNDEHLDSHLRWNHFLVFDLAKQKATSSSPSPVTSNTGDNQAAEHTLTPIVVKDDKGKIHYVANLPEDDYFLSKQGVQATHSDKQEPDQWSVKFGFPFDATHYQVQFYNVDTGKVDWDSQERQVPSTGKDKYADSGKYITLTTSTTTTADGQSGVKIRKVAFQEDPTPGRVTMGEAFFNQDGHHAAKLIYTKPDGNKVELIFNPWMRNVDRFGYGNSDLLSDSGMVDPVITLQRRPVKELVAGDGGSYSYRAPERSTANVSKFFRSNKIYLTENGNLKFVLSIPEGTELHNPSAEQAYKWALEASGLAPASSSLPTDYKTVNPCLADNTVEYCLSHGDHGLAFELPKNTDSVMPSPVGVAEGDGRTFTYIAGTDGVALNTPEGIDGVEYTILKANSDEPESRIRMNTVPGGQKVTFTRVGDFTPDEKTEPGWGTIVFRLKSLYHRTTGGTESDITTFHYKERLRSDADTYYKGDRPAGDNKTVKDTIPRLYVDDKGNPLEKDWANRFITALFDKPTQGTTLTDGKVVGEADNFDSKLYLVTAIYPDNSTKTVDLKKLGLVWKAPSASELTPTNGEIGSPFVFPVSNEKFNIVAATVDTDQPRPHDWETRDIISTPAGDGKQQITLPLSKGENIDYTGYKWESTRPANQLVGTGTFLVNVEPANRRAGEEPTLIKVPVTFYYKANSERVNEHLADNLAGVQKVEVTTKATSTTINADPQLKGKLDQLIKETLLNKVDLLPSTESHVAVTYDGDNAVVALGDGSQVTVPLDKFTQVKAEDTTAAMQALQASIDNANRDTLPSAQLYAPDQVETLQAAIQEAEEAKTAQPVTVASLTAAKKKLDEVVAKVQKLADERLEASRLGSAFVAFDDARKQLANSIMAGNGLLGSPHASDNPLYEELVGVVKDGQGLLDQTADYANSPVKEHVSDYERMAQPFRDAKVKIDNVVSRWRVAEQEAAAKASALQELQKSINKGNGLLPQLGFATNAQNELRDAIATAEKAKTAEPVTAESLTSAKSTLDEAIKKAKQAISNHQAEQLNDLNLLFTKALEALRTSAEAGKGVVGDAVNPVKAELTEALGEADKVLAAPHPETVDLNHLDESNPELQGIKQLKDKIDRLTAQAIRDTLAKSDALKQLQSSIDEGDVMLSGLTLTPSDKSELQKAVAKAKEFKRGANSDTVDANAVNSEKLELDKVIAKVRSHVQESDTAAARQALADSITKANKLAASEYLPTDAKGELNTAIGAAVKIKDAPESSLTQLKQGKVELDNAIKKAEEARRANLEKEVEALQNSAKEAAGLRDTDNLPEEAKNELVKAIAAAGDVLQVKDVAQIDEAALTKAKQDLASAISKAKVALTDAARKALIHSIDEANDLNQNVNLPAHYTGLTDAINKAHTACLDKESPNCSMEDFTRAKGEVDAAIQEAKRVIEQNKVQRANDLAALEESIKEGTELINSGKVPEGADSDLAAALSKATEAKRDAETSRVDLKQAKKELDEAITKAKEAVKKNEAAQALQNSIDEASKVAGDEKLPETEKGDLTQSVTEANKVLTNPDSTAEELTKAEETLNKVVSRSRRALEKVAEDEVNQERAAHSAKAYFRDHTNPVTYVDTADSEHKEKGKVISPDSITPNTVYFTFEDENGNPILVAAMPDSGWEGLPKSFPTKESAATAADELFKFFGRDDLVGKYRFNPDTYFNGNEWANTTDENKLHSANSGDEGFVIHYKLEKLPVTTADASTDTDDLTPSTSDASVGTDPVDTKDEGVGDDTVGTSDEGTNTDNPGTSEAGTDTSDLNPGADASTDTSDLVNTGDASTDTNDLNSGTDASTDTSDLVNTGDAGTDTSDLVNTGDAGTDTSDLVNTGEAGTDTSDLTGGTTSGTDAGTDTSDLTGGTTSGTDAGTDTSDLTGGAISGTDAGTDTSDLANGNTTGTGNTGNSTPRADEGNDPNYIEAEPENKFERGYVGNLYQKDSSNQSDANKSANRGKGRHLASTGADTQAAATGFLTTLGGVFLLLLGGRKRRKNESDK